MNSTNDASPSPAAPASDPTPSAASLPRPLRKKRRWWFYVLMGLGSLALLAVLAVVLLVGYWKSLIRDYTATQPLPLPRAAASPEAIEDLKFRWAGFWQAVLDNNAREPFKLSADDLNVVIANVPDLQNRLQVVITNDQLMGQFSVPLDKAKQKELQGRFINGSARLHLMFEDGWLSAQVLDLRANGKPVPGWVQKKVQKENIFKDLDRNQDVVAFLHKLKNVEVKDGSVILTP